MKKTIFILLFALAVACTPNREKGKLVSADEFQNLNKRKENNGERFSVIGYPFIDRNLTVSKLFGGVGERINFFEKPNGQGQFIGAFPIALGKGKNEFYVPEKFTMQDAVFYDNNGEEIKSDQKIQVSFTMELDIEREKVTEVNIGGLHTGGGYYGGPQKIRLDKSK